MENDYQKNNYGKRPLWQWILVYIVIGGILYGLIYYFFIAKNGGYNYSAPQYQQNQQLPNKIAPLPVTIIYTDNGFSLSTITIKKGTTVIFKNTASDSMRVASNPHPIHTGYPTTGGCVGSTFDSCNSIVPGSSWSFTFDIIGTWGYHNHLNPSEGGTIIVK